MTDSQNFAWIVSLKFYKLRPCRNMEFHFKNFPLSYSFELVKFEFWIFSILFERKLFI